MQYKRGILRIADLNQENEMRWHITRLEMLKIGLRFLIAAFKIEKLRSRAVRSNG